MCTGCINKPKYKSQEVSYTEKYTLKKEGIILEETKFAELNQEQLKEIKQLEEKLEVTLIAYDNAVLENQNNFGSTFE